MAFVANYDADDKNNCRVLNAEEAEVPYTEGTGITEVSNDDILVSWNGSMLKVDKGFDRLMVCDMAGRIVLSSVSADVADLSRLSSGCYVITVKRGQKQKVMKIMTD